MNATKEQGILEKVVSEAWNNPAFKQELLANPQAAAKKLTGQTFNLPEGFTTLQACDQSKSGVLYLNIPEKPNFDNMELTDKDLEIVAGGGIPKVAFIGCFMPPYDPPTLPGEPSDPIYFKKPAIS